MTKTYLITAILMLFVCSVGHSQTQWQGNAGNDWYNPNNWSNGVPDGQTDAIIDSISQTSPRIASGNATAKSISILRQSASLLVDSAALLEVGSINSIGNLTCFGVLDIQGDLDIGGSFSSTRSITVPGNSTISGLANFTDKFEVAGDLTVYNTGTFSCSKRVLVMGDFTLAGTIQNSDTIELHGDYEDISPVNLNPCSNYGTYYFNGSNQQEIDGLNPVFNGIIIDDLAGGIKLKSDCKVCNNLNLGRTIDAQSHQLDLGTATVVGGDTSAYIIGKVRRQDLNGLPLFFPVGDQFYTPIEITPTLSGFTFVVSPGTRPINTSLASTLQSVNTIQPWNIQQEGSQIPYHLKMYWKNPQSNINEITAPTNLVLAHFDGAGNPIWNDLGRNAIDLTNDWIRVDNITNLGLITLGISQNTFNSTPSPFYVTQYPVPTQNQLTIKINNIPSNQLDIDILNADGKLVRQRSLKIIDSETVLFFDLSDLPSGVYVTRVRPDGIERVLKFIKIDTGVN